MSRIEDEIRNEGRFRSRVEAVPLLAWTADAAGFADSFTRRWCAELGLTTEEARGEGWMRAIHPDDLASMRARWRASVASGQPFACALRLRRFDGVDRWFLARAEPLLDADGKVVRWLGTATESDDPNRPRDQAPRDGAAPLRLTAEAARSGHWEWDIAADQVTWTESADRPDGVETSFQGLLDQVHPDDRERLQAAVRQALRDGTPCEEELRLARSDGTYRWVLCKGRVDDDRHGRRARMRGVAVDLAAHRDGAAPLSGSEARSRASVDGLLDGFGIYTAVRDPAGRIVDFRTAYLDDSARRGQGPPIPQDLGRGLREHLAGHLEAGLFEAFRQVVETGQPRTWEATDPAPAGLDSRATQVFGVQISPLGDGVVCIWHDLTGRRALEDAFRRNEAEYHSLFEAAGIGNAEVSLDSGRFVRVNRAYCELTGYSEAELLGMTFLDLTHPDDRARNIEAITSFIRDEQPRFEIEKRYIRKNGDVIWVHLTGTMIRDSLGRPVRILGSAQDVTERRLAEERLRESELWFRGTFENAAVGIAHVGLDGRWLRVNETLCAITGYTRDELLSRTFQDITHPDDLATDLESARQLLEGEATTYALEKRYVRRDGGIAWVNLTVSLLRTPAGAPELFISVIQDISARRQAEEQIRRLNAELNAHVQELRAILDAVPVGINVARDPSCSVIVGNTALMEMIGMEPGENVSKSASTADQLPYRILKDGADAPPDSLPMQRAAATGQPVGDDLYEIVRADGSRIQILARSRPVCDAEGAVTGAVGICIDVTTLRRAEEVLREADRRKNEFLAVLAHELRNPLAAIRNAVELLRLAPRGQADQEWGREVIDRQVRHLARLVDDLLDVSRIARGKIVLRPEPVDLRAVANHAVTAIRPQLDTKRQALTVSLPDTPLPVQADPVRLEQILTNLLSNAHKYTNDGGAIALHAVGEDDEVVVRVRDSGIGLARDDLRSIFELFAQVDPTHERSQGGLGIGLTLVQNLVALHGGQVSATSEGRGRGSEFIIRLPRSAREHAAPTAPSPPAEASAAAAPSTTRRVLVVDDNMDSARGLARLLRTLGHEVVCAHEGQAALSLVERFRPELALLDIGMPQMDGYVLLQRLRLAENCRETVFIAVSGYAQEDDSRRSRLAGFDHHLVKPVDFDFLCRLLDDPAARPES